MTVLQLGVFALVAVVIGRLKRVRPLAMLGVSVFAIYWLQLPQQFVSLRFWLPTVTIALTALVWLLVMPAEMRGWRLNLGGVLTILGIILLVDLNQYFGFERVYMVTSPRLWMLGFAMVLCMLIYAFALVSATRRYLVPLTSLAIILLLIYLKTPALITKTFDFLYSIRSQAAGEG